MLLSEIYLGSSEIEKIYLGNQLVYGGNVPTPMPENIVVLGASLTEESFGTEASGENVLLSNFVQQEFGWVGCKVYGRGIGGSRINSVVGGHIKDRMLQAFNDFSGSNTYFLFHIGGNDVTDLIPYNQNAPELQTMINDLQEFIDVVAQNNKQGWVIPIILSYRDYRGVYGDMVTVFDDASNGVKPFWDNIFNPIYSSLPFTGLDIYNWVRNRATGILHDDGVHILNRSVNSLSCQTFAKAILTKLNQKLFAGDIVEEVRLADTNKAVSTVAISKDFEFDIVNHMNFTTVTGLNQFDSPLLSVTGHTMCWYQTKCSFADGHAWSNVSSIGRNTILLNPETLEVYDTFNDRPEQTKAAMSSVLQWVSGAWFEIKFVDMYEGENFRLHISTARGSVQRVTRCTHLESGNYIDITSVAAPYGYIDFTKDENNTATFRFTNPDSTYASVSAFTLEKL